MAYSLIWLPDVLRAAGLKVIEDHGWQERGRGDIKKVRFMICHHTASPPPENAPSVALVRDGRPGISGPLSQLVLGRDGTFYVIAAGRANHAGTGVWKKKPNVGNAMSIGIEAENNGVGEIWPKVQIDAYARGAAAILRHLGLSENECIGHKEYAPTRKIDPSFDMKAFRLRVKGFM